MTMHDQIQQELCHAKNDYFHCTIFGAGEHIARAFNRGSCNDQNCSTRSKEFPLLLVLLERNC